MGPVLAPPAMKLMTGPGSIAVPATEPAIAVSALAGHDPWCEGGELVRKRVIASAEQVRDSPPKQAEACVVRFHRRPVTGEGDGRLQTKQAQTRW